VIGIAFGLVGIANTWTIAAATLHAPAIVADGLWVAAAVAWVAIIVRYLSRVGRLANVPADVRHPVLGPFTALYPVVGSLLAAHLAGSAPLVAAIGVWTMTALSTAFGAWFVSSLFTAPRELGTVHGGYLLPTVAATLLAAQSLATIGERDIAIAFFAVGILFWLLIGAMVLLRLATGPALPPALLPTLAIISAPPAVAGNAWWAITGGGMSVVHTALAGTLVALLLPHLFLVRRYLRTGFAIGFWAMTFTAAASATYAVRLLTASGAGPVTDVAAWGAVALATALVGVIAVRSVMLVTPRRFRA
jgi:tellurite resistance protein